MALVRHQIQTPPPPAAACLQYHLDDVEQLKGHINVVEGRGLLFYPARLELPVGARVVLEVVFGGDAQRILLRGSVIATTEGETRGVWLDFQDLRVLRRPDLRSLSQRALRRLGCDLLVRVSQPERLVLGRLIDFSQGGARLAGASGLIAGQNALLSLAAPLPDGASFEARAEVLRVAGGDAAIRFLRTDGTTRASVARLFTALEQTWSQARTVDHPAACCRPSVLQPPTPRVRATER